MIINVDKTGTLEGFHTILKKITTDKTIRGLVILSCDANGFTPDAVDPCLKDVTIPLFGGIFPAVIHGREKFEKGTIIVGLHKSKLGYRRNYYINCT